MVKPVGASLNPSDPCTSIATIWPVTQLSARSLTEYSWRPATPTGTSSRDGDIQHGPGDDQDGIHDGRAISPHNELAPGRNQTHPEAARRCGAWRTNCEKVTRNTVGSYEVPVPMRILRPPNSKSASLHTLGNCHIHVNMNSGERLFPWSSPVSFYYRQ